MNEFIKALEELQLAISVTQIQAEEVLEATKKIADKVENLHVIYLKQNQK